MLPGSDRPKALSPEAQVLSDAAPGVFDGRSLRKIALDLSARGVPSPRRPTRKTLEHDPAATVAGWDPQSLRQLLFNPTIAGRRVHQGEDIGEATWAPIIYYSTWLKLRAVLGDPSRRTVVVPRGPEPRHPLSAVARCGECGAGLKAKTNGSRLPRAYVCESEGCRRVAVSAPRVDELVEAVLQRLFDSEGSRKDLAAADAEQQADGRPDDDPAARIALLEAERPEPEALRHAEQDGKRDRPPVRRRSQRCAGAVFR